MAIASGIARRCHKVRRASTVKKKHHLDVYARSRSAVSVLRYREIQQWVCQLWPSLSQRSSSVNVASLKSRERTVTLRKTDRPINVLRQPSLCASSSHTVVVLGSFCYTVELAIPMVANSSTAVVQPFEICTYVAHRDDAICKKLPCRRCAQQHAASKLHRLNSSQKPFST